MRICAPFAGIIRYHVEDGSRVEEGQPVASVEAVKVETTITAPKAGTITRLAEEFSDVVGGDSIFKLD